MKPCQIVGKIEPEELRQEIIFAAEQVEYNSKKRFYKTLSTWSNILNILVKRIVPEE